MHPAIVRFAAAVGRRVAIWFVVALVIATIRHLARGH